MKGMFQSVVLSVLLAVAGFVMIFGSDALPAVQAQGTQPYESQWKADQLYRVISNTPANPFNGPQIGVSRWKVSGQINNGRIEYEETWEGPSAQTVSFGAGPNAGNRCVAAFDRNKWLAGCFNSDKDVSTSPGLGLENVNLFTESDKTCLIGSQEQMASGITAACKRGFGSSYVSGVYSFTFGVHTGPHNGSNLTRERYNLHYTAIPLQWTVAGIITYNP